MAAEAKDFRDCAEIGKSEQCWCLIGGDLSAREALVGLKEADGAHMKYPECGRYRRVGKWAFEDSNRRKTEAKAGGFLGGSEEHELYGGR
jgi:hypothetical protein